MRRIALREDQGFTLVEMMVVIAVMAVLVVESVSNFQLIQDMASERAAQSDVRTAFASARVYYAESGVYTADPQEMTTVEPAIVWTNAELDGSGRGNTIFIATADDSQTLVLASRARDKCYFMRDEEAGASFAVTSAPGSTCVVPANADFSDSWPG